MPHPKLPSFTKKSFVSTFKFSESLGHSTHCGPISLSLLQFTSKTTKTNITLRGYYAVDSNDDRMSTIYGIAVNDKIVADAWPGDHDHPTLSLGGANQKSKEEAVRSLSSIIKRNKKGDFVTPPAETKIREATYAEILAEYNS